MKKWQCNGCGAEIEVPNDYEPQQCCDSYQTCGCAGQPINPVFCDDCAEKLFG